MVYHTLQPFPLSLSSLPPYPSSFLPTLRLPRSFVLKARIEGQGGEAFGQLQRGLGSAKRRFQEVRMTNFLTFHEYVV